MGFFDWFKNKETKKKEEKICQACGKAYPGSHRCEVAQVTLNQKGCQRIKYGSPREGFGPALANCVCCGVMPGSFHHWECGLEICPICETRLIVCECEKSI